MIRNRSRLVPSAGSLAILCGCWLAAAAPHQPAKAMSSLSAAPAIANQAASDKRDAPAPQTSTKSDDASTKPDAVNSAAADHRSAAERIAGLKRIIESDEMRLLELAAELNDPESEYIKAEREFQQIERLLEQKRDAFQKLKELGQTNNAAQIEKEIKTLEKERTPAKDLFEIAIEERKTLRDEIATRAQKIRKDREALDSLTGDGDEKELVGDRSEKSDASVNGKTPKKDATDSPAGPPDGTTDVGDVIATKTPPADSDTPDDSEAEMDAEVIAAEAEAEQKADEAEQAQEEVQSIAARIADLQKLIAQEQKSLGLARKKVDLAAVAQRELEEELARRSAAAAANEELDELRQEIRDAGERLTLAKAGVAESADRLSESQSELAALQSQQIIALEEAKQKQLEAAAAQEKVDDLRNPFAPRNLLQWLLDHGLRLAIMIAGMFAMLQFAKLFSHRTIKLVARGSGRGSSDERENRAKTLVGVFQNAVSVAIVIGGFLMILDEVGVKVTVLLGGMAVCGLAVAFGAQSLIKDYFYGFVMLLENQYMINDVIRVSEFTGVVERITLRMTVLRDLNGVVHFIPNGTINSVSNETHGWSRAVLEIGVAYKEDINRVIGVLTELTREFRLDPTFGPLTIEDATPPAVDSLGDSAVVLKFAIKTRPAKQVPVRRELLRRIKERFDELGIEIPFPQRTVYHRYEGDAAAGVPGIDMKRVA